MKKTPKKSSKASTKSIKSVFKPVKKSQDLTSVYIAILALVVIIVVFFLAYLSKMSKLQKPADSQQIASTQIALTQGMQGTQQSMDDHMMTAEGASVPAGSRVKFKVSSFKKLALQPLEFDVFDENGRAYTPADLKVVHEMDMHFFVVSATLRDYQHLHPTYQGGKWKVLANIPNPGTYYAYIDIAPVKGEPVVLRSTLTAQEGTKGTSTYPGLTPDLFAINKGFKVQLALSQAVALQQTVLSYTVTLNGKAVALSNYLGALGHVVILRESSPDSFMHVHPLNSGDAKNGKAEFMTTFVRGGRYTAFVEFKIGAKVYTFPVTFDIQG